MDVSYDYITLKWGGIDEDCFDIELEFDIKLEYKYESPPQAERFTREGITFTVSHLNSRVCPQVLLQANNSDRLKEIVAEWLNEHRSEIEEEQKYTTKHGEQP
jgi:hypothetical protein